jgi:hypothetical protein
LYDGGNEASLPPRARTGAPRRVVAARALLLAALLPAFALMLGELREPLRGEHTFRQAHVAANIEKYLEHGLSLRPETYNVDVPGALFDFPAYQLAVAWVCRAFGLPPLPTARGLNVALFALTLGVAARLLAATGATASERALSLAFFAWSPLNLFFWATPFVDPLAVLASLASLLGYVRWERGRAGGYAAMLGAGVLATLLKNPLYFPFFAAIAWARVRRRGLRALVAPAFAAFALSLAAAVVLFKLYSNHVNQSGAFLMPAEAEAYFGTLHDRLRRKYWRALLASLAAKLLPAAAGLVALAGLTVFVRRARRRWRALGVGLAVGVAVTLLLFFGRHREHDYYQLPFVFPAALFAGYGSQRLLVAAAASRRRAAVWLARAGVGALLAVTALSAHATWREMLDTPGSAELRARGEWLQRHTRRGDFVAVVVGTDARNWDPSHLYFAQRDGCNLARSEVTAAMLADLWRHAHAGHRRLFVFVPWPQRQALTGRLEALGARLERAGDLGDLYAVK